MREPTRRPDPRQAEPCNRAPQVDRNEALRSQTGFGRKVEDIVLTSVFRDGTRCASNFQSERCRHFAELNREMPRSVQTETKTPTRSALVDGTAVYQWHPSASSFKKERCRHFAELNREMRRSVPTETKTPTRSALVDGTAVYQWHPLRVQFSERTLSALRGIKPRNAEERSN